MKKPPHTTVRHNQLWVRMYVPEDVRDVLGANLFLEKIGPWPMPYSDALALSSIKVAGWKKEIELARNHPTGIDALIQAKEQTAVDVIENLAAGLEEIGGEAEARQLKRIALDLLSRVRAHSGQASVSSTSAADSDMPFLHFFNEWQEKTHLSGKTKDQALSDVKQFAASVDRTLGTLSGGDVQQWIETSLETASAVTIRRKLSGLRSYWGWLQSHERVSAERNPFSGRSVMDRRSKVERKLEQRQRFEPEEIVKLITACADDAALGAIIRLAAFTGARREGLASLRAESVVKVQGIDCFKLAEKTEAGVRTVPIHPAIQPLVKQLIEASTDAFLIPSKENRYGKRGDALGKRFTKLKSGLGFGENHTFHSIRHTVVHLFRSAGCPVEIRNQILGHEGDDTGSHYGGEITAALKLEWLEKAIRYPQ